MTDLGQQRSFYDNHEGEKDQGKDKKHYAIVREYLVYDSSSAQSPV